VGLGLTRVDNAASASMHGVEVSLSARLPGGFTIGGQVTYLDSRYREFCQPISGGEPQYADPLCSPGVADRSGNRLSLAPKWSGGTELSYNAQLGSIVIAASTAYDFSTSVFYVGAANENVVSSGSWGKLRARIGLKMHNALEFFVYGRNLTDERFLEFAARVAPSSIFETINEPRTLGVGVGYRY
jgi:iron complex outermembrane receptor protein